MSPATAALLARVRAAGAELEAAGEKLKWRAPEPLPEVLLEAMRARKAELLAVLRAEARSPTDEVLEALRRRIRRARDCQDLHQILYDAQIAFVDGELSGEEVEVLAAICAQEAHALPQHAPADSYGPRIYAADLLPRNTPLDTCLACRRAGWWTDRYGVRHCRVCHPPGPGAEA